MQTDKYTIAWFKIAEYVSRGEKERALGVYRLLSHSFNDDALASQLEADIYLSCNEQERAIVLYRRSFEFYKKSKRLAEAVAIAEHLVTLMPNDLSVRRELIVLYNSLQLDTKINNHLIILIGRYAKDHKWQDIESLVQEYGAIFVAKTCILMCQHVIVEAHNQYGPKHIQYLCIEKAVPALLIDGNEQMLQEFLAKLQAIDQQLYQHALECIGHR